MNGLDAETAMANTSRDRGLIGRCITQGGVTLIELMIVILIVSILAAFAYPSYTNQVRSARRTEAHTMLLEAQSKQERFFTENNTYAANMTALGYGNNNEPTESGWYIASVTASTATTFTLSAAPQNDQQKDTICSTLSIDHLGQKGESGTGQPDDCW